MERHLPWLVTGLICWASLGCSKGGGNSPTPPPPPAALRITGTTINGSSGPNFINIPLDAIARFQFSAKVNKATANSAVSYSDINGVAVGYSLGWEKGDSVMTVTPQAGALKGLSRYTISIAQSLQSTEGGGLNIPQSQSFISQIDPAPKFPIISDDSLLTLIQKQTFRYFWDFGHPVSGMARERNTSGDVVTSGGTGFGIMATIAAANRGFISREAARQRIGTITNFLLTKAQRFKGAFPHWLNGTSGAVVPFSAQDDGADLVETSFLAMGLLCSREYFDGAGAEEQSLRTQINSIVDGIEWNWFRKNNEQVLYWHWSPNFGWAMNLSIRGWNECLITYVMAASSKQYAIPDTVFHKGFARDGAFKNGKSFYGNTLPLGEDYGGPLFFSHYSFMGIDPRGLKDQYADYWLQQVAHSNINFEYCKANPQNRWGYSADSWGLTASDIPNGYTASSPTNDVGVIAPTAAVSAIAYVPSKSIDAIKYFYYTLGDKIWKDYGFADAFKLEDLWFANSFLAIDQGPQIVMIENYRSGLLWQLFTQCPEIKSAMKKLGFTAPYL